MEDVKIAFESREKGRMRRVWSWYHVGLQRFAAWARGCMDFHVKIRYASYASAESTLTNME